MLKKSPWLFFWNYFLLPSQNFCIVSQIYLIVFVSFSAGSIWLLGMIFISKHKLGDGIRGMSVYSYQVWVTEITPVWQRVPSSWGTGDAQECLHTFRGQKNVQSVTHSHSFISYILNSDFSHLHRDKTIPW